MEFRITTIQRDWLDCIIPHHFPAKVFRDSFTNPKNSLHSPVLGILPILRVGMLERVIEVLASKRPGKSVKQLS